MTQPADSRAPSQRYEASFDVSARQLGMTIFLVALGVLFLASIVAYWVTRLNSPVWRTASMPALPWGLWLSTAIIAALSFCFEAAKRAVRVNRYDTLSARLRGALGLAFAFLLVQGLNWERMLLTQVGAGAKTLYAFTFYMLTGLHALHVIGGLVPLTIVYLAARRKEYSSSRYEGLRLCAQYWHFLGGVWLVLLASILLGASFSNGGG